MNKITSIIALLIFIPFLLHASDFLNNTKSDVASKPTKNIVFTEAGIVIMGQYANLGYERILHYGKNGSFSATATYGYWKDEYEDGNQLGITANYLLGKNSHQLELNLGALAKIHYDQYFTDRNKFDHIALLPEIYVGYRFKKPAGNLMLKAGVGFPALASVGIGVAF